MTALAGYWSIGGGAEAAGRCALMLEAQSIYGPGAPAIRAEASIAIGRRLFATLPQDRYDTGPVASGGRLLVADVRLDNRDDLAASLGLSGGEAAGLSDADLLMRALDRWDVDALGRLVGDFAFGLWDGAAGRLLLARDFLGHRPLHYHRGAGFFAFASMPKGLHALAEIPVRPNRRAAADFLALLPETGSESFFEGVEKVQSGHFVIATSDGVTAHRYWDPPKRTLRLGCWPLPAGRSRLSPPFRGRAMKAAFATASRTKARSQRPSPRSIRTWIMSESPPRASRRSPRSTPISVSTSGPSSTSPTAYGLTRS